MSRRATIRTAHDDPELVARALRPDNTAEMETTVVDDATSTAPQGTDGTKATASPDADAADDGEVVTRIERETTAGLRSTVDDYVVNLEVAVDVARSARNGDEQSDQPADTGAVSDTDTNTTHNE